MKESQMQTLFSTYIKIHPPIQSEVYELKICKGTSLPFDSLKLHQEKALLNCQKDGLFHKITDPPVFYGMNTRFNSPRPFDCMYLTKVKAFVIILFYKLRKPKIYIKIPIENFIKERDISSRKSLTEARALEIGMPFLVKNNK